MLLKSSFKKEKLNNKNKAIMEEIKKTGRLIELNSIWFDSEKNHDLIDSCIYQRESLLNKYNYLISTAKKNYIKSKPKLEG